MTSSCALGIELAFMLFKLYRALINEARNSVLSEIAMMQRLTPVLYVFYRDGLLMFVP